MVSLLQNLNLADFRGDMVINDFQIDSFLLDGILFKSFTLFDTYNKLSNTFRGFHAQTAPFPQIKLVRCLRGSFIDFYIPFNGIEFEYDRMIHTNVNVGDAPVVVPPYALHATLSSENDTIISYAIFGQHDRASEVNFSLDKAHQFFPIDVSVEHVSDKDRI